MARAIHIRIITDEASLAALRIEWSTLLSASPASPFLTWEYISAWFRSFGGDSSLHILAAYRGAELVAILPLRKINDRSLGIAGVRLALIGDDHAGADHLDLIANEADRVEAAEEIVRYLLADQDSIDGILLKNLTPDSPLRELLVPAAKIRSQRSIERPGFLCPQVGLGLGWHNVLAESRRLTNFKRRLKQLEKSGGLSFRSVSLPKELDAAFARFLDLHNKRRIDGGSAVSGHPTLVEFHRQLIRDMAYAGLVRFDELWIRGECVASIYGFDDRRTFYYYNSGYDPAWAPMSVGMVLTGLSIRAACDRGRTKYDFLRGEEAYKFDWANGSETLTDILVVSNTIAGKAIAAHAGLDQRLRGISHAILPTVVKDRLREWRRLRLRGFRAGTAAST